MKIVGHCQDRALLLLQVAQECPQFKERAAYLAQEWLVAAAIVDELGLDKAARKERLYPS